MTRGKSTIPSGVSNGEGLLRLNFLYQAAIFMSNNGSSDASDLGRFYLRTMRDVSQKLVIRMDPKVKRSVCKMCDSLLTGKEHVRIKKDKRARSKLLITKCGQCSTTKSKSLHRPAQ